MNNNHERILKCRRIILRINEYIDENKKKLLAYLIYMHKLCNKSLIYNKLIKNSCSHESSSISLMDNK